VIDSNQTVPRAALSIIEAARSAGLGRSTVCNAIADGKLRTLKVGNRRLVRPADLGAWLDSHAVSTGAAS
jgi:excisionase family DNA binding protein